MIHRACGVRIKQKPMSLLPSINNYRERYKKEYIENLKKFCYLKYLKDKLFM